MELIFSLLSPCRRPPAEPDVEDDSAQTKWDRLHSRLLTVEESWLRLPSEVRPSSWQLKSLIITLQIQERKSLFSPRLIITFFEPKALCCVFGEMGTPAGLDESCVFLSLSLKVTDSSRRRSDGTAGRRIGTQTLKELQTHISHLRELGHTAAESRDQVHAECVCWVMWLLDSCWCCSPDQRFTTWRGLGPRHVTRQMLTSSSSSSWVMLLKKASWICVNLLICVVNSLTTSPSPGVLRGRLPSDAGRGFVSCAVRRVPVSVLHHPPAELACRGDTWGRRTAEAAAAAGVTQRQTQIHWNRKFKKTETDNCGKMQKIIIVTLSWNRSSSVTNHLSLPISHCVWGFLFRVCLQSWLCLAVSWPLRGQRSAVCWGQSAVSSV